MNSYKKYAKDSEKTISRGFGGSRTRKKGVCPDCGRVGIERDTYYGKSYICTHCGGQEF